MRKQNQRKKLVYLSDLTRVVGVFGLSLLCGMVMRKLGIGELLCFAGMIAVCILAGVLSQKLLRRYFAGERLLTQTAGFFWLSVLFDVAVISYLLIEQAYMMLAVLLGIYLGIFLLRRTEVLR